MQQFPPPSLSRSSSTSSILSDASTEPDTTLVAGTSFDILSRRTRKRFSNVQLMMLEHLYHQTSHPTRDQRDALAKEANMETRSVTVWFQNKRQTERRIALNNAINGRSALSSPFSASSGHTIHTHNRSRTRALSTQSSPKAAAGLSRTALRPSLSVRQSSLDHIAARAERPHRASPPSTPHKPRPHGLWESMPSSPPASDGAPAEPHAERALVDFGRTRVRRMRTLEWACAAARVERRADQEQAEDTLVLDLGGDTEDEGEHEAVTPKSSIGRNAARRSGRDEDKENVAVGMLQIRTRDVGAVLPGAIHDEDVMNAALALCGLGARR